MSQEIFIGNQNQKKFAISRLFSCWYIIKWVLTSSIPVQFNVNSRKILLLGSGFVAKPTLDYLARDPKNHITVGPGP
jgi:hypothetical protein